jgi:hypothetical protein
VPESIVGWTNLNDCDNVYKDFVEQPSFVSFLHATMAQWIDAGGDEGLRGRAVIYRQGWMHIGDERALAPVYRAPDPDDIVGVCLVKEGEVVCGSYQPMPTHRLFNHIGQFLLPQAMRLLLMDKLINLLEKENNVS